MDIFKPCCNGNPRTDLNLTFLRQLNLIPYVWMENRCYANFVFKALVLF